MKQYERHPLSAKYDDITGDAWDDFVENARAKGTMGRKIILHEGKVLDGWQLYRACLELGIEAEFADLPKGWDAQEYVDTVNDRRRHESADKQRKRAEERRARVAALRSEGKSQRAIAEEVGVSQTQVARDIATAEVDLTEPGGSVQPTNGVVNSRDGVQRPAVQPKIQCAACARKERVGQDVPKSCPDCKALRNPREPGDDTEEIEAERQKNAQERRQNGRVLFDDRSVTDCLSKLAKLMNDRAQKLDLNRSKGWLAVHARLGELVTAWDEWRKAR